VDLPGLTSSTCRIAILTVFWGSVANPDMCASQQVSAMFVAALSWLIREKDLRMPEEGGK
jgi:hypothetical protein